MNQLNLDYFNIDNKEKKAESSDEESFQFFQVSSENNLLKNKRKYSIENFYSITKNENENCMKEKEKNDNDLGKKENQEKDNISSISYEEEEKTKKTKKKKKKNYNHNFKPVKSKAICQFYINGACKKGDKCPYSHDAEQIHKKELCKFFLSGKCMKGDKCLYSHDLSEIPCKYYHGLGFCENFKNCPFSHERLDEEGIKEFIKTNEDYLKETKKKYGRTNMDVFFNEYMKEKEGGEQYVMLPDFIKKEDKEKQKNEMNDKIPLGFIVMSNNNKIINEIKNFYNFQNKLNNNFNFSEVCNNANNCINNSNNNYTLNFGINYQKKINNNDINVQNIQMKNKNNNNTNNSIQNHKDFNSSKNINNNNLKKKEININNNDNLKMKEKLEKGIKINKNEQNEKKKNIPNIEINPFMNPMLFSNKDIINLF